MDHTVRAEESASATPLQIPNASAESSRATKGKARNHDKDGNTTAKRRCVSTACIACRRRKSKCDGNTPKCAACASVYLTDCEYAPHTDHRRKGVYKKDMGNLKTRNSTLQILIQAILNYAEEDVPALVQQMRTCENLEELAESIIDKGKELPDNLEMPDSPLDGNDKSYEVPIFEAELSGKMGDLVLEGSVKFIGGTSNLIWMPPGSALDEDNSSPPHSCREAIEPREEAVLSWTTVSRDKELILHLVNMYFCWHYAYFTTLSKELFYRDFLQGVPSQYCSSLLVNVMLALGCHFTSRPGARADPEDSATIGNHFFKEAKRLIYENDEFAIAKLCTVQALALMSVREAGCGREGRGWVYSGMSFRLAYDLSLNVDAPAMSESSTLKDENVDARRITFWGCYLFDKCWSNYLGRQPQLVLANVTTRKPHVFPFEDSEVWSPYTDLGVNSAHAQPARTRAVALQVSGLAEISSDLLTSFYHPNQLDKPMSKQAEVKKLTELHTRLETWKRNLPQELEPKDGQLPQVLLMHMFFQLLFIHLYRPFLKYNRTSSPLPPHISPRRFCTQAAGAISKLLRLYRRTYGLQQICNIAVYMVHSACTIHLLNLPDNDAKRDIVHGVNQLEEIGESWTCARRTLRILSLSAERWKIDLPEEADTTLSRTRTRWGTAEPAASPSGLSDLVPEIQDTGTILPQVNHVYPSVSTPQQYSMQTLVPHQHNGMFANVANSPAGMSGSRRSSGGGSLPPQSAADLVRGATRNRTSTYLTKEQQDAWNAHQLARSSSATQATDPGSLSNANAAVLFGGVDSLVEESQDWWLKDQSALAFGFDNWNMDQGTGWPGLGINTNDIPVNRDNRGFEFNDGSGNEFVDYVFLEGQKRNTATMGYQRDYSFEVEYS